MSGGRRVEGPLRRNVHFESIANDILGIGKIFDNHEGGVRLFSSYGSLGYIPEVSVDVLIRMLTSAARNRWPKVDYACLEDFDTPIAVAASQA